MMATRLIDAGSERGSVKLHLPRAPLLADFVINARRNRFQIPDQSEPREHLQSVIGQIEFPPKKSLAGRAHKAVMIVVPALAEGDQGEPEIVPAVVIGRKTFPTPNMRQRIDEERPVQQENRADKKAPDENLRAGR